MTGRNQPSAIGIGATVDCSTRTARRSPSRIETRREASRTSSRAGDTPQRRSRHSAYPPSSGRNEHATTPKLQPATIHASQGRKTLRAPFNHAAASGTPVCGRQAGAASGSAATRVAAGSTPFAAAFLVRAARKLAEKPVTSAGGSAGANSTCSPPAKAGTCRLHVTTGAATSAVMATTSIPYRAAAELRRIAPAAAPARAATNENCHSECTSTQPNRSMVAAGKDHRVANSAIIACPPACRAVAAPRRFPLGKPGRRPGPAAPGSWPNRHRLCRSGPQENS